MVDDRRIHVIGSNSGFAPALVAALTATGEDVRLLEPTVDRSEFAHQLRDGALTAAVIFVAEHRGDPRGQTLAETDATSWDDGCEAPLRAFLAVLQGAHDGFAGRTGRIVLVVPTIGISGAPAQVAYATAVEGLRAMAKSAARQWASVGITVNSVLVSQRTLAPSTAALTSFHSQAAMSATVTASDVVPALAFLIDPASTMTTGATVVVDGGSVMTP